MKIVKLPISLLFTLIFGLSFLFSCTENEETIIQETEETEETPVTLNNEVNEFVWAGLNEIYLWQQDVPDLADDKFTTYDEYYTFLNGYNTPESLFDAMLYQIDVVDRFSYIVDDYVALENSFQGTSNSNGLDFQLVRLSDSDDVFGYVRYVANNSDAATKNINRGEFFLTVDGQQITVNNYIDLLFGSNNTYTLGMADITNSTIALNGKTVELTKTEFTENPILVNKVIETNGVKIGYLMYNGFVSNFDNDLNNAFADLKSQGINELVLDLRYNPGGSVRSAINLSGMITGQFNGGIFSTEKWNNKYQAYLEATDPEYLINRFTDKLADNTPINSLKLNKVYILTTEGSASASELVINCLRPYIDVVQIGTVTTGKYTASITLYDSPDYGRKDANPNHKYAIQPLVLKSANKNGVTDYYNGLTPDYLITYQTGSGAIAEGEDLLNLGTLGDENEVFLAKAISLITGSTSKLIDGKTKPGIDIKIIADTKDFTPLGKGMYKNLDKAIK
ncbi:S41 family peptidase [Aestuariibaculum suncheonense]|uniref:Peptidase S41 n=1 Tax=Aestuariibaculum suncheonense TaxID=1028745 RepID=A0A8J6UA13_9FLAO|nr:S41 family peptidase [Aestuariibaculum suncheonense]MBD0834688.1 peptidase S41 [Aestuariibaculum suncheonense]